MKELKKRILPICALCGEALIFVLDENRRTLEVFPCVCGELEQYEAEEVFKTWFPDYTQQPA